MDKLQQYPVCSDKRRLEDHINAWTTFFDRVGRSVSLTEEGAEEIERRLAETGLLETDNLYDVENTMVVHHLDQALKANIARRKAQAKARARDDEADSGGETEESGDG